MIELHASGPYAPLILRPDALAAGATDRELRRLLRTRVLHRVRPGAYVATATWESLDPAGRHALLSRAVLSHAGTEVVLSHVSALPEYDAPTWRIPLEVVHVTRRDRRAGRNEAGVRQHQGRLGDVDVVTRNNVPVTSATRLAIDITTVAETEPALAVVNDLLHRHLTSLEAIEARYASMTHDPYTLGTGLVLLLADGRIESVGETRTFFCCWRHSLPAPQPQWEVRDHAGLIVARLDLAWPELGAWVEFDGRQKYTRYLRKGESITDAVLREKQREDMIRELTGWRCLRITWADLNEPERLAQRIRSFLRATTAVA
ncbi:MAG: hypothetical protein ABIQ15_11410 [Nocardioides sp.]